MKEKNEYFRRPQPDWTRKVEGAEAKEILEALYRVWAVIGQWDRGHSDEAKELVVLVEFAAQAMAVLRDFQTRASVSPEFEAELGKACATWRAPNCADDTLHALAAAIGRLRRGMAWEDGQRSRALRIAKEGLTPVSEKLTTAEQCS